MECKMSMQLGMLRKLKDLHGFVYQQFKRKHTIQNRNNIDKIRMVPSELPAQMPEGLTKREQSKIQRLRKSEEAGKSHKHAKSYKRKAPKTKHAQQTPQRKLIKITNENNLSGHSASAEESASEFEKKPNPPEEQTDNKKSLKAIKPYNPKCKVEGGQEGLFGYMIMYSYSEKEKKIEGPEQDLSFVDGLSGKELTISNDQAAKTRIKQLCDQFNQLKQNIEAPFDDVHRQFTKKVSETHF